MMTDKQIIIDGVDVSGCKHYKHNDKNSGWSGCTSKDEEHIHSANPLCCEKKDCLYKQFKAKEQECERLKETCKEMNEVIRTETTRCSLVNSLKTELDQLKAENEELKETLKTKVKGWANVNDKILEEVDQLKAENEELKKCYKNNSALLDFEETNTTKLVNKVMKLEKVLAEIKEIAEEYRMSNSYYTPLARKILQKIREVENV